MFAVREKKSGGRIGGGSDNLQSTYESSPVQKLF